jgi:TatD DNase family protein
MLIETDCPYLTPPSARRSPSEGGQKEIQPASAPASYGVVKNEPIFVKYVAERIAELKGISFDEVASATTANAKKLFKI